MEEQFQPELCTSDKFIYDDMTSQSGYSLPIIYRPFDGKEKSHWVDRGFLFDFLYSIDGEGKKLLDFGPGDGWPSLIIAPYAKEVVGLDASYRRIETCIENANRLGINNAKFICYSAREKLPFDDDTFDGIMAASSIEQTPNPKITLAEIYRVLKPAGRVRILYESLNDYKNDAESDIWIAELKGNKCRIILFNRNIEEEYVIQYGITLSITKQEVIKVLSEKNETISYDDITVGFLEDMKYKIIDIKKCKTLHPSGRTFVKWLKDIGFKEIIPSHNGGIAAANMYDYFKGRKSIEEINSVDEIIKPIVKTVTQLEAPIEKDPAITAIK